MKNSGSKYINEERRKYSIYVLQNRAIPYAADGLKSAARRVLWVAKGSTKIKSATLAGATLPIHPHASPDGVINILAAPYVNNIPLLTGDGAFGTLLAPTSYGASRYTSVKISKFTKDVVFCDIDIIPMQDNYDGTLKEPTHFLPLVPMSLINQQDGIAVGFASSILPRDFGDIVSAQINYLKGLPFDEPIPKFTPTGQKSKPIADSSNTRFEFIGEFKRISNNSVEITNLPYGMVHEKYIEFLNQLEDSCKIQNYVDNSKDSYSIKVKFSKGASNMSDIDIIDILSLRNVITENMTILNFDGATIQKTTPSNHISEFCDWRLGWYKVRYENLVNFLEKDIQKYRDIILAIDKNIGAISRKIKNKSELVTFLKNIGIINVDYISDLPIYRLTEDEKAKIENKLSESEKILMDYKQILGSVGLQKKIFISELEDVLSSFKAGTYSTEY